MYIEPNTTIRILKDVPLDTTYEHTIWFPDINSQTEYFYARQKYTLDKQSYQRVQRGWMRVGFKAEDLYDCNYLMFRNISFGDKWFYAFIKSVEYINNSVSQIQFEIDVLQTWYFDYTLDDCFVERQHTETDELFANTVPEKLEIGDTAVCNGNWYKFDCNTVRGIILASQTKVGDDWQAAQGVATQNTIVPFLKIATFNASDNSNSGLSVLLEEIYNTVNNYVKDGHEDSIVTVYLAPTVCQGTDGGPGQGYVNAPLNITAIDGYTPKNKKLFCYPYNYVLVSNNAGSTAIYKLENWSAAKQGHIPNNAFAYKAVEAPQPTVFVYPIGYRGIADDYESGLVLDDFPVVPWIGDRSAEWWGQNKNSILMNSITGTLSSMAGLVTGTQMLNIAGDIGVAFGKRMGVYAAGNVRQQSISAANGILGTIAKYNDLQNTPPQVHGQTNMSALTQAMNRLGFTFYNMSIKAEYARIVDDYFTRFGYAIHRTMKPNVHARPHWTYLKTQACTITGSIPCDDANTICSIYDNGITFWADGLEVGNYSLDNKPLATAAASEEVEAYAADS